jgi:charged multivesicular body protein 4
MASWGFGSLWGGNAAKKKDSTKNAILGLRSTLEMLSKREKHLQNQMDEQDAIARKHVSSNKSRKYLPLRERILLGWNGHDLAYGRKSYAPGTTRVR